MTHRCYECGNLFTYNNLRFINLFSRDGICKPCASKYEDRKLNQSRLTHLERICDVNPGYQQYFDTIEHAVPNYSRVEFRNGGTVYSNTTGDEIVMGDEPKKCTCCD